MDKKNDELFKDSLSQEKCYEFLLKIKSLIKKQIRRSTSLEYLDTLKYGIIHLKQYNEKESISSLLDSTLDLFISKYPKIPESLPKEEILKKFIEALDLYKGMENSRIFKSKFLSYCKKNSMDEKYLKVLKCYDIFAKDSILSSHFIDAYNYCMKCENKEIFFELFTILEDNANSGNSALIKGLGKEEFLFLVARTTTELLINKKMEFALEFIGKFYKKYGKEKIVIDFAYLLTCLLIREPKGFDHFWALINIYKPIIGKKYDLQFYLNKISIVYYNKPFLKNH